jgi:hypothetical protein
MFLWKLPLCMLSNLDLQNGSYQIHMHCHIPSYDILTYICIHIHAYMHCSHRKVSAGTRGNCAYRTIHTYIHTYKYMCVYICIHKYTHSYTLTCTTRYVSSRAEMAPIKDTVDELQQTSSGLLLGQKIFAHICDFQIKWIACMRKYGHLVRMHVDLDVCMCGCVMSMYVCVQWTGICQNVCVCVFNFCACIFRRCFVCVVCVCACVWVYVGACLYVCMCGCMCVCVCGRMCVCVCVCV